MYQVGTGERPFLPSIDTPLVSQNVRDMIQACWSELPGDRLQLSNVRERLQEASKNINPDGNQGGGPNNAGFSPPV